MRAARDNGFSGLGDPEELFGPVDVREMHELNGGPPGDEDGPRDDVVGVAPARLRKVIRGSD